MLILEGLLNQNMRPFSALLHDLQFSASAIPKGQTIKKKTSLPFFLHLHFQAPPVDEKTFSDDPRSFDSIWNRNGIPVMTFRRPFSRSMRLKGGKTENCKNLMKSRFFKHEFNKTKHQQRLAEMGVNILNRA